MPFGPGVDFFAWSTESFSLDAGQDRYLCYAKTLEQSLVVNGYSSAGGRFLHHVIFSRATAPEPEGFSECDGADGQARTQENALRDSWEPLFITGAGDARLELPEAAGHQLNQGSQLVVQMHLLNLTDERVEGSLTINMRRSTIANPRPVSTYVFGTTDVELPPLQKSEVVGTCGTPWRSIELVAGFAHMHTLGTSLRFEVGAPGGAMQEVFKRDPYDFDNQRIEPLDFTIAPASVTRVTCTFDNPLDQTVSYGEGSRDEMCFFFGFALDITQQETCIQVPPLFGGW
jgi:hypothetical protein